MNTPLYNTYRTSYGTLTVRPRLNPDNRYGFILETVTAEDSPAPRAPQRFEPCTLLWALLSQFWLIWAQYLARRPPTLNELFCQIVPAPIHQHLIVVTPPPSTPLALRYPTEGQTRIWISPPNVQCLISASVATGVPQFYVHDYPVQRLGEQRIKQGSLVFIRKTGILITQEYGPLPIWPGWRESFVVSEGRTIDHELVLVYVLHKYMEPPEISVEEILDEIVVDGNGRWRT